MVRSFKLGTISLVLLVALVLVGCAPAATPAAAPTVAAPVAAAPTTAPAVATKAPAAVTAPAVAAATAPAAATKAPTAPAASPTVAPTPWAVKPGTIRLATTTSTADTGLLDWLLPQYTKATGTQVDVVAVGTGQALAMGQRGDADVLLVHAPAQEEAFVKAGDAKERFNVMYNDFVLVGPANDPAKVAGGTDSAAAFKAIAAAKATFVSRGDKSGTNTKELSIWASAGITPTKEMTWYNSIGQGMGDTLIFTNEKGGYTLADRGTWLATESRVKNLKILVGGNTLADNKDRILLNPYGVMAVSAEKHPGVEYDAAVKFVQWFKSADTMKLIGSYGIDKYGQALFYPDSAEYRAATGK